MDNYPDFTTLAQLATHSPQMMGNAPMGGGATAGMFYAQDRMRQQEMMDKAAKLAEIGAMLKAQSAEEQSRGHLGRLADIDTQSGLSQARNKELPALIGAQSDTIQTGATDAKTKRMEAEMQRVGGYANTYLNTDDPDTRQEVINMMKKDGITKIGSRNVDEVPPDKMEAFMKAARQRMVNTPAQEQKMNVEVAKEKAAMEKQRSINETKLAQEKARAEAAKERANIYMTGRVKAAEIAAKGHEARTKWEDDYKKRRAVGDTTDEEDAQFSWLMEMKLAEAQARAANAPSQPDLKTFGVPTKEPTKPTIPPAPAKPSRAGTKGKFDKEAGTYIDENGKVHKVTEMNIKTGEIRLEDGKVIKP